MARKKKTGAEDPEEESPKITDIAALRWNVEQRVADFCLRWMPMPGFGIDVEVMGIGQLRNIMGLHATADGDPWPAAEKMLMDAGFRWQWMGSSRVMFLREKEDYVPDDGWQMAETV